MHSIDVGEAYRAAVFSKATGAFNVAADPVLDPDRLGELLEGLREGRGLSTPPLDPNTGGPFRSREIASGVGARAAV